MACANQGKYPLSDHYDGERFFQPGAEPVKGFGALLKWQFTKNKKKWPDFRENTVKPSPLQKVGPFELGATFINHATFLLQLEKGNVLTDPVFSTRTSPVQWAGPERVREPGILLQDLPKVDVVVISHNHYDHMDKASVRELDTKFSPLFVVPLGNAKDMKSFGAKNVVELDWWQSHALPGSNIVITLVPVQHWSSRTPFDRNKALWGGYVIESPNLKIYFGGDTGYGPHFKTTGEKLGPFDLSLIPIGAYEPRWFMKDQHINPEEAVQAHIDLNSKFSIGVHFGTFQLTDEGIDEPIQALQLAKEKLKVPIADFVAPENGESRVIKKSP